jgi:Glu-tRNA(Gln) amidotransferase subunit E-like FAD-binding protein
MERMTTILSLMLLNPLTDRLDSYNDNSTLEEVLGLTAKQQMEIEDIYEKYLVEINDLMKSNISGEERCKIFNELTLKSKKQAEKLLTIKQLKMLSADGQTA